MKLGSPFPDKYFLGSSTMKKDFFKELVSPFSSDALFPSPTLISSARAKVDSLVDEALISSFSKSFCKACFKTTSDEFFILPTSTTGKYHGGRSNLANCVGGNIHHTSEVLGMAPKVLRRYDQLVDDSSAELLRVSCILHDIAKVPSGEIYTKSNHGELGAKLVGEVWKKFTVGYTSPVPFNINVIKFAVSNHMYLWKFYEVINQLRLIDSPTATVPFSDLLIGLMLSECDFYSF